jgi:hypothetical protein
MAAQRVEQGHVQGIEGAPVDHAANYAHCAAEAAVA